MSGPEPPVSGPPPAPFLVLVRRVLGSRTAGNTFRNAAGTVIAASLSFGTLVLATRAMGAAPYGLFALALAVLTMALELADLGVNAGAIRHASFHLGRGDAAAARAVISVVFRVKLAIAAAAALFLLTVAGPGAALLGRPEAAHLLRIAALGLAGSLLHGMTSAVLQAHERFGANAVVSAGQWGIRLLGTGALVATGRLSPAALLWVYVLSPWITFLLGLLLAPRGALTLRPWDRERARELLHFSRWMALWGVLTVLLNRFDVLLLGKLSTDEQVGFYAASQRVALLVALLVNAYVMTLIPYLARIPDRVTLRRAVRHALYVSLLAAAGIVVLMAAAPWVVGILGLPDATGVLRTLLVGTLFLTLALPFNSALNALNRPQFFALESGIGLVLSLAGNLWLIPRYGAWGAAAVYAVVGFVVLLVAAWAGTAAMSADGSARGPGRR